MKRLISLISTAGKSKEQIIQETWAAFQKYQSTNVKTKTNEASDIVLPVPLGKDSSGRDHFESLLNLGHILIAGQTGSGKSSFIHFLVNSLMSRYPSAELKLFLADPKRVEHSRFYNGLPHLIIDVGEDPELIFSELSLIHQERVRRLSSKNSETFPYIVIILDTFSDVVLYGQKRFELMVKELTSDSDKTKIHVVMCDSRVGESLFTENLKNCFPTKIAFTTPTAELSVVIIGQEGAERLERRGDMLLLAPGTKKPALLHVPPISDEEIERNVADIKRGFGLTTSDAPRGQEPESSMACHAFIVDIFGLRYMLHIWTRPYFSVKWHRKRDGLVGKIFWVQRYN